MLRAFVCLLVLSLSFTRGSAETIASKLLAQAEQGDVEAQARVGSDFVHGVTVYQDGSGFQQDKIKAEHWLKQAAKKGHPWAQYDLGSLLYEKGDEAGVHWLELFVEEALQAKVAAHAQDHLKRIISKAQYMIGRLYYQQCDPHMIPSESCSPKGTWRRIDTTLARHWFMKAAESGNRDAQYALAGIYELGRGVPQDYSEAIKWYRQAAENGETNALRPLGDLSLNVGDPVSAHMWLNLASSTMWGRDQQAIEARDRLAKRMTPEQITTAQKRATEWAEKYRQ